MFKNVWTLYQEAREMRIKLVYSLCIAVLVFVMACNFGLPPAIPVTGPTDSGLPTPTDLPDQNATAMNTIPVPATSTLPAVLPSATASRAPAASPIPSATNGPQCTAMLNLNFYAGPGSVYDLSGPIILKDAVVIPKGYQKVGFPGGSWVQVINPAGNKLGWVYDGPNYLTCTIDISTLPKADFPPTPRPTLTPTLSAPNVSNTPPNGALDNFIWKLDPSGIFGMRLEVYLVGGKKDGDHIKTVTFTVKSSDGKNLVTQKESSAPYCLFGGDNTCAPWPMKNGRRVWPVTGQEVKSGSYPIDIEVETDDPSVFGSWNNFKMVVKFP
jgi:hypothetical protein